MRIRQLAAAVLLFGMAFSSTGCGFIMGGKHCCAKHCHHECKRDCKKECKKMKGECKMDPSECPYHKKMMKKKMMKEKAM